MILKDGGLLRGTIVEKTGAGAVTLQLVTGEIRKIPPGDIEYAGLAADAPKKREVAPPPAPPRAAPPPAPPPAPPAWRPIQNLRLEPVDTRSERTVHIKSGETSHEGSVFTSGGWGGYSGTSTHWRRLCTAPCTASVPPGRYQMGVEDDDGKVREVADTLSIDANTRLRVRWVDRSTTRLVGGLLIPTSIVLGALMISAGASDKCTVPDTTSRGQAGADPPCVLKEKQYDSLATAGGVLLIAGVTLGIVLVTRKDYAELIDGRWVGGTQPALRVGIAPGGVGASGGF